MGSPTSRALALLGLLQTHRTWSGPDLANRLGVSERTVRRDVDRLRELGYPVDAGPGVDGGYRLAAGTQVPPLLLTDDDAVALVVGLAAAASSVEGIEETTVGLLAKLEQILPDRLRRRVEGLNRSVEVLTWSPKDDLVPVSTLTVLSQGCRDREEVRFEYQRRDGGESRRLVRPHQLVSAGRRWYLVAWDVRREDWRTFRVDRMAEPVLAGVRFNPQTLPAEDAATFVAAGMRAMSSEHEARIDVGAPVEEVEPIIHWFDATATSIGERTSRVVLRAESIQRLASMVVILATQVQLHALEGPDGLAELLALASSRLEDASAAS